jgi:hypothetical protein
MNVQPLREIKKKKKKKSSNDTILWWTNQCQSHIKQESGFGPFCTTHSYAHYK